jgi:protein-L-isoaspartate O-methyltransferase
MYEVTVGIMIKDKEYEAGSLIPESEVPKKSLKWLKEQGILVKPVEKKETKKVRARNEKGHYIADDPSTEKNEAYEEEE